MMKTLFVCLFVIVLSVTQGEFSHFPGGWRIHDPYGSHKYAELAHFALTGKRNAGRIPGIAIRLHHVASQVVAGMKYSLSFDLVPLSCTGYTSRPNSRRRFRSMFCIMSEAMNSCTATVHEVPWTNFIRVVGMKCLQ
uniref:Putative salivary cystatin n=1 Tax=Amblyomma triste TaxID=251400 RepID=A0A023G9K1_AMBTT